ncbi:MAG: YicC/YloC family endoribonuclease [Clostridia bacterium]|nr:YicC/YloC family endoribonuclease [Clostridia bacterium]
MIKSMTGYGRNEAVIDGKKIYCEIKSVNHRYSDYSIKVPRNFGFLEDKIKKVASEKISRGKVDIYVGIEYCESSDRKIYLNSELAKEYLTALGQMRDELGLRDDISVMNVARLPDIFRAERLEEDEDKLWDAVSSVVRTALDEFTAMREREGERIEKDLTARIEYMRSVAAKVEERSPETVEEYKNKLYSKIKDVLDGKEVDEARVLTEVAIFADKIAVNEETVRLCSHFDEFYKIISSDEPAGRRLDFLIQEINREINTTGSKANDIEISRYVVELKGETEKLREQVQNIE